MPYLDLVRRAINEPDNAGLIELAANTLLNCDGIRRDSTEHDRIMTLFERYGVSLEQCDWTNAFVHEENQRTSTDGHIIHEQATLLSSVRRCLSCDNYGRLPGMYPVRSSPDERPDYLCSECLEQGDYTFNDDHDCYVAEDDEDNFDTSGDSDEDSDRQNDSEPIYAEVRNHSVNVLNSRLEKFVFEPGEQLPLNPFWMGVELEVEPRVSRRDCLQAIFESTSNFAILKNDGSLNDGGFEIVSVPATLASHRRLWQPFFDTAAKKVRSWTSPGHKCGMHVHVSNNAVSNYTFGRALVFINQSQNCGFIEAVAGRAMNTFCRMTDKKVSSGKMTYSESRYEALTISDNTSGTYELRIFRGNVRAAGFFKNLEFTHAMFAFCAQASATGLDYQEFLTWMSQPSIGRDYKVLLYWLRQKGLLPESRSRILDVFDFVEA